MKRYSLTPDLKNDPGLIQQYEQMHKEVWPEIMSSIKDAGIENMQIYRYETRMFMRWRTRNRKSCCLVNGAGLL